MFKSLALLPRLNLRTGAFVLSALATTAFAAPANAVVLTNATATFSQNGFDVSAAINGSTVDGIGWAIDPLEVDQTAVWETQADISGNLLSFQLVQNYSFNPQHLIGRFRLSTTTDNRSTFADGLSTGGDVSANWTVLTAPSVTGPAGMSFTTLGDNSVLASGPTALTGTYSVAYAGAFSNVTGIRLEVLEDPSLPFNGPGLHPFNGNFVLTEITVDATSTIPVPPALPLLAAGIGALALMRRRQ